MHLKNEDDDQSEGNKIPPASTRTFDHDHTCQHCSVWVHLGSDPQTEDKHRMDKNCIHPNENVDDINNYLAVNDITFSIRQRSCLCNACYQDWKQKKNGFSQKRSLPRWVIMAVPPSPQKYYPVCHYQVQVCILLHTPCKMEVTRWGPKEWTKGLPLQLWSTFFKESKGLDYIFHEHSHLCRKHYIDVDNKDRKRICQICGGKQNDCSWHFALQKHSDLQDWCSKRDKAVIVRALDWECNYSQYLK